MSNNETLILKYRPKVLKDVIGQDSVVKSLSNVIKKDTSHTFLFVGPSGTGKTTLARIAADMLGCAGSSVREIDAATFTGIDAVREITANLSYKPIGGGKRAIIADECHAFSKPAWQALLKNLEEPPSWLYWFLCTTDVAKVPENIRTRCTKYELKPVPLDDIQDLLEKISAAEKMTIDEKVMRLCAKEAFGSPRQSLVNLALCSELGLAEAKDVLKSASSSAEAIELARLLNKQAGWGELQAVLKKMKDINPESVRHVVRAYMTNVVLGSDDPEGALAVLSEFSTPFNSSDGISPLVLACGRLLFR